MQAVPLALCLLFVRNNLAKVAQAAGEPKEMKTSKETIRKQDVLGDGIRSDPEGS